MTKNTVATQPELCGQEQMGATQPELCGWEQTGTTQLRSVDRSGAGAGV